MGMKESSIEFGYGLSIALGAPTDHQKCVLLVIMETLKVFIVCEWSAGIALSRPWATPSPANEAPRMTMLCVEVDSAIVVVCKLQSDIMQ